jgi:hypothetical protein
MQHLQTDSPSVPLRARGWPTKRSPRWVIGAGAVLLVIAVAIGLAHRPTHGERASDLRGLLSTVTTDVESCSGGVRESLYVLHQIDSGASHDMATALNVANTGSANCSPANNEQLDDLTSVQVPESLDSYHLVGAVDALIDWTAPNAINVQADVATVLSDRGKPSEAAAVATLNRDLAKLNRQRALVYADFAPAIKALSPHSKPPLLNG